MFRIRRPHVAVTVALVLVACRGSAPQDRQRQTRARSVTVTTTAVQRISVQRSVDLTGNLVSPDSATVSSEVAGVVRDVPRALGQTVAQGDVLVHVEPRELQLALDRAVSALRQTQAQLGMSDSQTEPPPDDQVAMVRTALANRDDARAQDARATTLSARGLLAAIDTDTAHTKLKVAEAAYQSAVETVHSLKASLDDRRAAVALAQKKLNDASIRAPISGAIAQQLVQPGEYIKEGTPVMTIVQMDPLKLTTGVQEKFAGVVTSGMPVQFTVEPFPGQMFHGRVISISPQVDQTTRTFVVEAELPNHDLRLKPGFFAKGAILTHQDTGVIAAPDDAISTLAGVSTVYVIEDSKVRPQTVSLGVRQGPLVEITDGLKGSETLATSNLSQLSAGVQVSTGDKLAENADSRRTEENPR